MTDSPVSCGKKPTTFPVVSFKVHAVFQKFDYDGTKSSVFNRMDLGGFKGLDLVAFG